MNLISNLSNGWAQVLHTLTGYAAVFTLAHFMPWRSALALVLAIAFVKELLEALGLAPWEPRQTLGSSGIDFLFFVIGGIAAVLMMWAAFFYAI